VLGPQDQPARIT